MRGNVILSKIVNKKIPESHKRWDEMRKPKIFHVQSFYQLTAASCRRRRRLPHIITRDCERAEKKCIWFVAAAATSAKPGSPIYVRILIPLGQKTNENAMVIQIKFRCLIRTQFATNTTAFCPIQAEKERCEYEWKVYVLFDRNEHQQQTKNERMLTRTRMPCSSTANQRAKVRRCGGKIERKTNR